MRWCVDSICSPSANCSQIRNTQGCRANVSVHEVFGFNVKPGPTCLFTAAADVLELLSMATENNKSGEKSLT